MALSGDGNTLAVGAVNEDSAGKGVNPAIEGQGDGHQFGRGLRLYAHRRGLETAGVSEGFQHRRRLPIRQRTVPQQRRQPAGGGLDRGSQFGEGINGNQNDTSMPGAGSGLYFCARRRELVAAGLRKILQYRRAGGGLSIRVLRFAQQRRQHAGRGADQRSQQRHGRSTATRPKKSAPDSGAVFVSRATATTGRSRLTSSRGTRRTRGVLFGYSVGLSGNGDTMAVGTYDEERGRGAVYAFTRKNGKMGAANAPDRGECRAPAIRWDARSASAMTATPSSPARSTKTPSCPAFSRPSAGAHDEADDTSSGAAYVWVRKDGKWSQQA